MEDPTEWEVFETPDVESPSIEPHRPDHHEQHSRKNDDYTVSHEALPAPEEVFEVFAGKKFVNGSAVRARPAQVDFETPFEWFNRLKTEVEELVSCLADTTADDDQKDTQSNAFAELADGATALQKTLDKLSLEAGTASLLSNDITQVVAPDALAANEARADALREQLSLASEGSPAKGSSVTYQIYGPPPGDSKVHDSGLVERVRRLEAIVGLDPESHSSSSELDRMGRPIANIVSGLERKLELMDESRLALLNAKATELTKQVSELSKERKSKGASHKSAPNTLNAYPFSSMDEAGALVEKLERCNTVAATLPGLTDRLRTVQEIHLHNANVHTRLEELDIKQTELEEANALDRELLENLKQSMLKNLEAVEANMALLGPQ